jgi:hypothetical protein
VTFFSLRARRRRSGFRWFFVQNTTDGAYRVGIAGVWVTESRTVQWITQKQRAVHFQQHVVFSQSTLDFLHCKACTSFFLVFFCQGGNIVYYWLLVRYRRKGIGIYIRKQFRGLIRGPGACLMKKKRMSKISWKCTFKDKGKCQESTLLRACKEVR